MALCPVRITERGRERLGVWLALLNSFVAFLGLVIIGMGVYVRVYVEQYTDLLQDYNGKSFVYLLVSVGLLTVLIHLLGAKMCYDCGYWRTRERFQAVLLIYVILVFLLFFLVVSSAIVAFLHKVTLANAFESGFSTTMTKYRDDPAAKERFDRLQMSYRCCGSQGYKEWFDLSWISNKYLNTTDKAVAAKMKDGEFITESVPFSCCNPESERPCVHHDVTNSHRHVKYDPESPTLFDRGCVEPLMEFMHTRVILPSAILAFFTSFSQIVVFIVARYLQTSIHSAYKWNRPRGRSLGYIIEQMPCSCMEELHTAPGPDEDEEYGGNQATAPLIEKQAQWRSKKSSSSRASTYKSASSSRSGSTGYSVDSGSHRSRRDRGLEQRLSRHDDRRLSNKPQPQGYNPPPMEDENEKGFEDLLAAAADYDEGGGQQQDGGGGAEGGDGGHEGNQSNKDQQRQDKKDAKSEKKEQKEQKKAEKKKEKEKKKQEKADKKKQKKEEKEKNKKDKKEKNKTDKKEKNKKDKKEKNKTDKKGKNKTDKKGKNKTDKKGKNKTDKKGKGKKDKKGSKGKSKKKTLGGKKLKKSGKAKKPKPKKIKRKKPKMKKPKMKKPKMKKPKMKRPKMRKMKAPKMRRAGGGRRMGRRR